MSWRGGNNVMRDLIEALCGRVPMPEYRTGIYKDMIESLKSLDWDCCVSDFEGQDRALDDAFRDLEMTEPDTKPCVLCDKMLEPAVGHFSSYQPYGGGEIKFIFSYGSKRYDQNIDDTVFRGLVCDECGEKFVPKMDESE